jgi:hypothetical protein
MSHAVHYCVLEAIFYKLKHKLRPFAFWTEIWDGPQGAAKVFNCSPELRNIVINGAFKTFV